MDTGRKSRVGGRTQRVDGKGMKPDGRRWNVEGRTERVKYRDDTISTLRPLASTRRSTIHPPASTFPPPAPSTRPLPPASGPAVSRLKLLAFLLLLLPALHFAATEDFFLRDWKFYAVLSAFISILVATLLLLVARALDLRQWETVFKSELVYGASTIFLVLLLVGFIEFGEPQLVNISKSMYATAYDVDPASVSFPSGTTLVDVSKLYMVPLANCMQRFIQELYIISIPLEAHSAMYQEMFMGEQATGGGSKPLVSLISTYTKSTTFYMLAYFLLVHILNFIRGYALFFLSVGVVLRAFPPTRGAGAYIMALAIGLYIVFPFSFIFMSTLASTPLRGMLDNTAPAIPVEQRVCNMPHFTPLESCGVQNRWKDKESESWIQANLPMIQDFLYVRGGKLQQLTSNLCMLPFLAMVAVLTFVINTTNLFGGSIPEIGRGLVKLI